MITLDIDFDELRAAAVAIAAKAYAPYSHYPVGAAGLGSDGQIYVGCNVENAGYGVTLCAECGLVSSLVAAGRPRLLAFVCVNKMGDVIMPCGRCRQLLFEHGGPEMLIETPEGVMAFDRVLPMGFGPSELDAVR